LPEPFLVLATQNPIEYEGTFPLPEAQLDRFMIKVSVGYPVLDDEVEIMQRRINRKQETITLRKITHGSKILDMRKDVEEMHVNPDLQKYIASLVHATREDRHVAIGASPRGSLAFLKMARALAAIRGRDYVVPADIKHFAIPVLSHRMILKPEFWLTRQLAERVITDIFNKVPIPVLEAS
jgi:MoxR-like ATPase